MRIVLRLLPALLATTVTAPGCRTRLDEPPPALQPKLEAPWPMFGGGPEHRAQSRFVGPQRPATRWSTHVGERLSYQPVVASGGAVITASMDTGASDDGVLHALDSRSGTVKWRFQTAGPIGGMPAVGSDDTVFVGAGDQLYAIDVRTGTERWRHHVGSNQSFVTVGADDLVVVCTVEDLISPYLVHALDGRNGAPRWTWTHEYTPTRAATIGADGTVYIPTADGKLYALDGASGRVRWSASTGGRIYSPACIGVDGSIYVGSWDRYFYSFDTGGRRRWAQPLWLGASTPAIGADGTVYVGIDGVAFVALDPDSGAERWRFHPDGRDGFGGVPQPAVGLDGMVYVMERSVDESHLYVLDGTTGRLAWDHRPEANPASDVSIGADGALFFSAGNGAVYAIGD